MTLPSTARSSQTKIVATIGPACKSLQMLRKLTRAGVDLFRINTAHGSRAEHDAWLKAIREVARLCGHPVGVLVDLVGPKIRLGSLPNDRLECPLDSTLTFVRGRKPSRPNEVETTYKPLIDEISVGDRIMLADGTVTLSVESIGPDDARCRVIQSGVLRSRQGVNLPGIQLSVPTVGPKDCDTAVWAARSGVDFIGLSFVRSADDVRQVKALIDEQGSKAQVIAKIEKPEALDHLEAIVEAADGIMVARGDLGVEIDIAQVAVVQKQIVATCARYRKPVIIATQMLDSMQRSRIPTRAEVTDVANAILDGADACMLSGETAIGEHPIETVEMMHRIALATEPVLRERPPLPGPNLDDKDLSRVTESIVYAAGRMSEQLDARLTVVGTASGRTALTLSKYRNFVPTVGVSDSETTLRRMCLYWGVFPLAGAPTENNSSLIDHVTHWGRTAGMLDLGDRLVLVTGTGLSDDGQNTIAVHEVE